ISSTVKILRSYKPFFSLVNFFSQMTLLCSLITARRSSTHWDQFEQQLFTLFGDPNEVRNAKFELNSLSMKDNGKALSYIAQFRTLQASESHHQSVGSDWSATQNTSTVRSGRKTNSTPSTSKNEDASKRKSPKKFPSKPSTPFASSSASRPKRSTKIASVLNKEGQLNEDERPRREFVCIVVVNMSWTLVSKGSHKKLPNWQKK
ncbi:hypothetical protein VP01_8756g1, partial [Puccinia sorghi]